MQPWAGWLASGYLSGGSISPDGSRILIRRSDRGWMWRRFSGQTVADALRENENCKLKIAVEQLGEAITVDYANTGYITTSEGINQPIWYYEFLADSGTAGHLTKQNIYCIMLMITLFACM